MSYLRDVLSAAPQLKRSWNKSQRFSLQNAVRAALPKHRAAACLRHRLGASAVTVSTTKDGGTRLGGLMVCDSFHVCPVCHHKKMGEEKATIAGIVERHYAAAGFMVDAVLTVHHEAGESLAQVLERLESVWKSLRIKKNWEELTTELGIVGCVRRLEVTLTDNGWHPHYHVSFLCDWRVCQELKGHTRDSVLTDAHAFVSGAWANAGRKLGLRLCLRAQAAVALVAAVDAAKAVEYNAKNMGYSGKKSSLTPMDLLRIIDQAVDSKAVHAAKRLFADYAETIKGKHVLTFLGSARAGRVKTLDKPRKNDTAERLGTVSVDAWVAVSKSGLREEIAQVTKPEALVDIILRAARSVGYEATPLDWLVLEKTKP